MDSRHIPYKMEIPPGRTFQFVVLLLCATGLAGSKEPCVGIPYNFEDKGCPPGYAELWKDSVAGQTQTFCCDPEHVQYKDYYKAMKQTCRPTSCQPSSYSGGGGSTCSSLVERSKSGKPLEYDEILREPCTTPHGSPGILGLCCEEGSMEGRLATTLGSEPNEFPHMAKLRLPGHCGGTVYNAKWIVTAAHCIVGAEDGQIINPAGVEVILGSNIGSMRNPDYVYKVKRLISHPGYSRLSTSKEFMEKGGNGTLIYNDLGLLELDREIGFGPNLKALEMAPKGFHPLEYSDQAVIVGWGTTSTLEVSEHLLKTNVALHSDQTCFGEASDGNNNSFVEFYSQMKEYKEQLLCLGGVVDGKYSPSAGPGDSGGPAICRGKDGKIVLCGVTSFVGPYWEACFKNQDANKMDENCWPNGYAEVQYFQEWIKGVAGKQDPETFHKPYLYGKRVPKKKRAFPHQVHITSSAVQGQPCGGTLVAPNKVVTAAHCVAKPGSGETFEGLKVTTGINDLNGKGKTFRVKEVRTLPGFGRVNKNRLAAKQTGRPADNFFKMDLAVIKMDGDVDISPAKFPVLPEYRPEQGIEVAFPRSPSGSNNTRLTSRDFRFLGDWECQRRMERINMTVDRSILCGVEKYSGGSTCDRELGGGVICASPGGSGGNKEELCGVQVFRMCDSSLPNGFMNMLYFQDFVKGAMK